MIDLKTATYTELCREQDRVTRAISIPGCAIERGYLEKVREACDARAEADENAFWANHSPAGGEI